MFAVVRTGGKQYRVAEGDKIAVEKLAGEAGDTVVLGDVLLAGEGEALADAAKVTVAAEIIAQAKSEKVTVFKKRRRHNYRRKAGHRQQMTLLRITAVGEGKKVPAKKAAAPKKDTSEEKASPTVHKAAPVKEAAGSKPAAAPKKPAAAPTKDTSEEKASPTAHKAAPLKEAAGSAKADTGKKAPAPKAAAKDVPPKKDTSEEKASPTVHKAAPAKEGAGAAKSDLDTTNLSLISGIGPTIEKKLHAAGIKDWNDIAAWDEATAQKMNDELKLGNRPVKDEWVAQAKELLAGKPPRAKVDQAEAAAAKKK